MISLPRLETPSSPPERLFEAVLARLETVVVGKRPRLRLALACLLARGHLLIEDLPGVGKTTLAQALARVLGLEFKRIQFTSDLLPADVLGVSIYHPEARCFQFHPGPLFAQVVLADEINRATPKTQSALLEAMEERQVSADGVTYPLPEPFFVIATQNPFHLTGTFPLPESQLDRFLMRIDLGYPDRQAERALLEGGGRRELLATLEPVLDAERLRRLQDDAARVHASAALLDYLQDLVAATRAAGSPFAEGLSPRGALAWLAAARAWALIAGREMVLPEDVQAVAPAVLGHRLRTADGTSAHALVPALLESVPVP